ncbi:zinc finger protein 292 [Salmo salar]|uniref:Zinc finger protein 292 n=1 Tax=Salmo salar TaxID=8030 RepID=A0A1S3L7Z0_SALSA|nr:zinc finger protein 292-like [Salmo salar]|eukprot:XP_013986594.1 PREDICTED: zinc finger protein 292-like [Salmo salar]
MAEGETEKEYATRKAIELLRERFQELTTTLKESPESPSDASLRFCQEFCQILVEHAGRWKAEEEPLPLLEVYTVAILSYAKAITCLSSECENVPLVLENLGLSCVELLLSLPESVPGALWEEFQSCVKSAHSLLQEHGNTQLHMLSAMAQEPGVWTNTTLCSILSNEIPEIDRVHEFLQMEGPTLLNMRIKHLIKQNRAEKAAVLAKMCSEYPEYEGKGNFKQTYLVCLCMTKTQEQLMQEIMQVDCKDGLEMICNLESDGDEKGALCLCSAFLERQLLQGDVYCAWELTLFWSKLLMRSESSADAFLGQCRKLVLLSRSVCHILFLIKVIQSEVGEVGLPVCIEMCIQALQMASSDNTDSRTTICKTISCLLPTDFEVKRACQLTEFLFQPTVDSYYAVEALYNEPDEKLEDENLPVPNSLRCELLLALKTQWPFDPEFWDWRTLKRNCLALMGEEGSIVSSIDTLNDTDEGLEDDAAEKGPEFKDLEDFILNTTNELNEIADEKEKNREAKKLREKGFVSARFRNWRAYMQYCVLCDKEFLGHRIVRHAQKHFKDGVYTCPICADSFDTKEILEPHVASHVKQSCKERLAAMKATRKLPKPTQSTSSHCNNFKDGAVVKLEAETIVSPNDAYSLDGNCNSAETVKVSPPKPVQTKVSPQKPVPTRYEAEFTEDCVCPVTYCQKVFKFFRSLVTHVKAHKNDEEATRFLEIQRQKVVCQYCRRQFVNARHLNDHLQMHCGAKPYYCIQLNCTASFHCNSELLMHKKQHTDFKSQCMFPNCGRIFNEAYLLYDHEAQHYLTFTCKIANCGNIFYSQSQLNLHQQNHDTNEMPITSENNPIPEIEPSTQCSARQEETCSASVNLDQKTAQDYVTEEVAKSGSSTVPENPKGPMKIKHSVESMLSSSVVNPRKEFRKCYVPLIKTKLGLENAKLATVVPRQEMIANHVDPQYHCGTNPLKVCPKEEQNNRPIEAVQKVLPQAFSPPEIKSEPPFILHPYQNTPAITGRDEDEYSCPLEACDRKYSTSKSLSRHVKKNHPDIFEDWKLAKKYKKVVKITSRKVPSVNKTSQDPEDKTLLHQAPLCRNSGLQQFEYPVACSNLPAICPVWETPPNQTGLMQSEMGDSWTSTLNDCYAEVFHLNEYPNKSVTPWQSEPYQLLERGREHTPANMHDSAIQPIKSESSLMNQMSEYVSSSLMLDNGGQHYGITNSGDNVDISLMGKNYSSMSAQESNNLSAGGSHASYVPNEYVLNSRASIDIPSNAVSQDGQVAPRNTVEMTNMEDVTHLTSPNYENQMSSSVDEMLLSPHASIQKDFSYSEDTHAESEAIPADEKIADHETQKVKRCRLSKRTKWPAIIKDGKVICRRCFREFSSTKSLGGHLSKRSQCKPLVEMDLTADLPTSFLDFLNDPNVPETGSIYNVLNGEFPQEVVGNLSTPNPSNLSQKETQKPLDSQSSNTFPSVSAGRQSKLGPNKTVWIELKESKNYAGSPQDGESKGSLAEKRSSATSFAACQDDKVIEIQNALQMLDLVEAAHEKSLQENCSSKYSGSQSNAISSYNVMQKDSVQSMTTKTIVKKEDQNRDNGPKPFKCEMDYCEYGFMTKEALFRHLGRVHDYTIEMIEELKKTPVKFSPYPCYICPKTFTRTTGLRIHYEKVHHLTQAEMNKLKVGNRKKRSSNPNIETEVESSHGTESSVVSTFIKQEPLDIDTGCPIQSTNQDGHAQSSEIITAGDAVQEDSMHQLTVERVQSPQDRLDDFDKSFYKLESPSKTRYTKNETLMTAPQINHTPVLKQNLGQGDTAEGPEARSDARSYSHATEAASSQAVKPSPEKASCSKNTISKDEVHFQRKEKVQKRLGLQLCDADNSFSPYRPYRCVHEGCAAAFTIQQNLILHSRAMHQSSLPLSSGDLGTEKAVTGEQAAEVENNEIRCQVKDCSRIFPGITTLVQHYLLLHKFTRDKTTAMMSSLNIGTFQCDRSECTLSFTSVEKYIDHIKNFHKEINISERGSVDQTFKCGYDGCDRVYTTKSNLLRHEMKKHDLIYIPRTQQQRTTCVKPNNGKENIENSVKLNKKNTKKDDGSLDHWTNFGKPSLKSMDEASTICTQKLSLQYPCMIKGCDIVERTERNIFKHYTTHGLAEKYIEDQRSQFIFCKKYPRSRVNDANKSEGMSTDTSEETDPDEGEPETSETNCQRQEVLDGDIQAEAKLATDEISESQYFTSEVKKRGCPRKSERRVLACPDRRLTLRNRPADKVHQLTEASDQGSTASQEEESKGGVALDSFLKFLDTSPSTHTPKRKMSGGSRTELPLKRQRTLKQKTANIMSATPDEVIGACQNLVDFRNPQNLQSVNNVKIVMDKTFSDGADLLLKQLQDMRPMVIIQKWLYS